MQLPFPFYQQATPAQQALFRQAIRIEKEKQPASHRGIGTLQEKSLHRILKYYIEPITDLHEKPLSAYIADIYNENGITEVQTGSFYPLRQKLITFLPLCPVTLIHPLFYSKTLYRVDAVSGSVSAPRHSPLHACVYDCAKEFFWIADLLTHENLTVRLLYLQGEEWQTENGGTQNSRRCTRRILLQPTDLLGEQVLHGADAFSALIPFANTPFTVSALATAIRRRRSCARYLVYALERAGILFSCGKDGRKKLYMLSQPPE